MNPDKPTPKESAGRPQINLAVSPALRAVGQKAAKNRGLTLSALLRMLLIEELNRQGLEVPVED